MVKWLRAFSRFFVLIWKQNKNSAFSCCWKWPLDPCLPVKSMVSMIKAFFNQLIDIVVNSFAECLFPSAVLIHRLVFVAAHTKLCLSACLFLLPQSTRTDGKTKVLQICHPSYFKWNGFTLEWQGRVSCWWCGENQSGSLQWRCPIWLWTWLINQSSTVLSASRG